MRKLKFCIKYYFFPNKRKNLSPFRTGVPAKFQAFCTLVLGAERNI